MAWAAEPNPYADIVLGDECAAANQLLLASIRLLHRMMFMGHDEYVLTAALAAGMEKMVKLTLGLIREDVDGGTWPSAELRQYGHDVAAIDAVCRDFVESRVHERSADELRGTVERMRHDRYIGGLLALVSDYGKGGRFYNLDYLGGDQRSRNSVRNRWFALIQQVGDDRAELGMRPSVPESRILRPTAPTGRSFSVSLRASVEDWRDYYLTAWQYGLCGPRAQRMAENISDYLADS